MVTTAAFWMSSYELAPADLVHSLSHIRYHPVIVQQAQGRSAETAVSPRYNYLPTNGL
jgi:hypothetical protein